MYDERKTPAQLRREILDSDKLKDVSIYLVVPIAITAGLSALAGMCGMIMARALVYFRQDVDAYFLTCAPFMFPVITGLFSAYKKQFGLLCAHFVTLLMTLLLGGFGFGMSVEPLFINRQHCQRVNSEVDCNNPALSFLYLISGSLAVGFAIICLAITSVGMHQARGRISKRQEEAYYQHMQDLDERQKRIREMNSHDEVIKQRARALSRTSQDHHMACFKEVNGVAQSPTKSNDKVSSPHAENTKL